MKIVYCEKMEKSIQVVNKIKLVTIIQIYYIFLYYCSSIIRLNTKKLNI